MFVKQFALRTTSKLYIYLEMASKLNISNEINMILFYLLLLLLF